MSTHTIKSYFGKTLDVTLKGDSIHLGCQRGAAEGDAGHLRIYKRADLLDALGAVSTADMAREIGEAQGEANRWQTAAEENERRADEWKARAESAEAIIKAAREVSERCRVRAADADFNQGARAAHGQVARELDATLNPKPAFTLPTEAGAIVLAKGSGNRQDYELHRTTKGKWFTPGLRQQWTDDQMLAEFTGHRLLGADE